MTVNHDHDDQHGRIASRLCTAGHGGHPCLARGFRQEGGFKPNRANMGLSLLMVPAAFTYVDGLERRMRRFFGRRSVHAGVPSADEKEVVQA